MDQEISQGQWKQMRGALKSWWERLTDDDFDWVGGEKDKLIGLIQQKYGQTRDQAKEEVERRLREFSTEAGGAVAAVAAKAQEFGAIATTRVREAVDSAKSYLQDRDYSEVAEDVTGLVRRYPVRSLLIGVGIGFLLARTMRD